MMKPVIGVMPLWDDEKESIWMLPGYLEGVREAGGIPVILPLELSPADFKEIARDFDGFLFTGGHDVSPSLYGEEKRPCCGAVCTKRDVLESMVFDYCWERDVPALGICRGLQLFNALLGGTLYQDLKTERDMPHAPEHVMDHKLCDYDWVAHLNYIVPGSPLDMVLGEPEIGVNSLHHQAVKKLSPKLRAMAYSEDGLVEAAYAPGKKFIWALQWHPEYNFTTEGSSILLFEAFLHACGVGMESHADIFKAPAAMFTGGTTKTS